MYKSTFRTNDFYDVFNSVWINTNNTTDQTKKSVVNQLPINIYDLDDKFIIEMLLGGYKKEDIDISIEKNTIIISGERNIKSYENSKILKNTILDETFSKSFTIDDIVDRENIKASMDNGILTVEIGKKEESKPQKIKID